MNRRLFLGQACGWLAAPRRALAALPPTARLNLVNAHTGETFAGPYRDANGPIKSAMQDLSEFLRDFRSGKRIGVDVAVVDFLAAVVDAVGASRATVLSAYRTVETNSMLARTGFGVADNSQHLYGRALDIRPDGRLEEAMEIARAMRRGGVGWYPSSGFIHIDSGPVRNWTLDGRGFDQLLRLDQLLAHGGLSISERGELFLGHARRRPSMTQRLALHRAIARAEALALRR